MKCKDFRKLIGILGISMSCLMNLTSYAATANVETIKLINYGEVEHKKLDTVLPEVNKFAKPNHKSIIFISLDKYDRHMKDRNGYNNDQYISERFIETEDGKHQVLEEGSSTEVIKTSWFKDSDGRWYAFNSEGDMLEGIIQDVSRKNTVYILDTSVGEKGALVHANGNYKVNGKMVHLTFNNNHDGHFGTLVTNAEDMFK